MLKLLCRAKANKLVTAWVCLPGCSSTAFTAWVTSTQQVSTFLIVAAFGVKAMQSQFVVSQAIIPK